MGTWRVEDAKAFLELAENSSKFFLNQDQISKGSIFEVMVFNSMQILGKFKQRRPSLFLEFEADYSKELYSYAVRNEITNMLHCDFWLFLNQRFNLYNQEFESALKDSMPFAKTVYNFYEQPLTEKSGISFDNLLMCYEMPKKMDEAAVFINQYIDRFIAERNL